MLLFGSIFVGTKTSDASWTPSLALDLEGGTQIILTPVATNDEEVTSEDIDQAISVIRQRIDSSGVAEAEITSQGGNNIVVSIPGTPDEETLDLVRTSAHMEFRPVLALGAPTPVAEPTPSPSASEPADEETDRPAEPSSPSDAAYYITDEVQQQFDELDCTDPANLTGGAPGDPDTAFVTCDPDGTVKYILGPVEIEGTQIDSASSGLETLPNGTVGTEWVVNMEFDGEGTDEFADVTERLQGLESPQNQFAMVLDGLVISAPSLASGVVISDGKAEISGNFTRESAATLANQLNFGSLPLTFEVKSEQQISATLGDEQLRMGLIAGLIGLALVVVYSLAQYRALGLVTILSLVVAGLLTYGVITLLSWTQGYRLSLPGVAGLIVAIGITADSFIVYFERIRDEIREGRSLDAAVDRAWERARRTILASDAVNFIAAVVLYLLAVGGVRGFAFTLGLTTIIDVVVVFLFTHPMIMIVSKIPFFRDGHRMSGLDPRRLGAPEAAGARYVGRGKVAVGARPGAGAAVEDALAPATSRPNAPVPAGAATMTIAERRAAERAAAAATAVADAPVDDAPDTPPPPARDAKGTATTEGNEH